MVNPLYHVEEVVETIWRRFPDKIRINDLKAIIESKAFIHHENTVTNFIKLLERHGWIEKKDDGIAVFWIPKRKTGSMEFLESRYAEAKKEQEKEKNAEKEADDYLNSVIK